MDRAMERGRPRVTHVITKGDPMGGAQLDTYYSAVAQQACWDVELIAGCEGALVEACRAQGIATQVVPLVNRLSTPLADLQALLQLWRHLRQRRPDIVHTHSSKAGVLGRLAARLAGVPVIIHTIHGPSFHDRQAALARRVSLLLERAAALVTDHFVSVADTLADTFVAEGVCPASRISTVASGIDFAAFPADRTGARAVIRSSLGIEPEAPIIIAVAELARDKALDLLIDAAARLVPEFPDVRVLIVGRGDQERYLHDRIEALGLSGRVILTGFRRDVPDLLLASDVFVQTSWREGISRSLVEAMYARLPCVVTDVGSTADVVRDGVNGFLVPPGDVTLLTDRLLQVLRAADRARHLGDAAHDTVAQRYSVTTMARSFHELYERLLRDREPRQQVRIVFVIDTLVSGGAERHVVRLVEGLLRSGRFLPSVYCLSRFGPEVATLEALGVEVRGLDAPWCRSPTRVVRSVIDLLCYLRRERPEIAHCYLYNGGILGAVVARLAGIPYVITTRRWVHDYQGLRLVMVRLISTAMDRCSDRIISVCQAASRQAMAEGTPSEKIRTIYNGVPLPPLPPPRDGHRRGPVFGCVAELHPRKGLSYLLDAFPTVLASLPQARLLMIGDGVEREQLEVRCRALGIEQAVDFLGVRADIPALLQTLDVFVLPSLQEGLPNVILEAMVAGLPIVATPVGGVPEVVDHGVTGLLVSPGSVDELAAALIELGRDPARRALLGQRAWQVPATRFGVQREIDETIAVYEEILDQSTGEPLEAGALGGIR